MLERESPSMFEQARLLNDAMPPETNALFFVIEAARAAADLFPSRGRSGGRISSSSLRPHEQLQICSQVVDVVEAESTDDIIT